MLDNGEFAVNKNNGKSTCGLLKAWKKNSVSEKCTSDGRYN
jgi:hypothetical protein